MTIEGVLAQITWTITSPMGNSIPIGSSGPSVWKSKQNKNKGEIEKGAKPCLVALFSIIKNYLKNTEDW